MTTQAVDRVASVPAPATHQRANRLAYIDALRGWAILAVLVVHTGLWQTMPAPWNGMVGFGARGVQLFYIVSAWTLLLSMQRRFGQERHPYLSFGIRRLCRIAPMFYVALVLYLWLFGTGPSYWAPNGIRPACVVANLFFVSGLHPEWINAIVPGGWSVAVEMTFYLLVPLMYQRIRTLRSAILWTTVWALGGRLFMEIGEHWIAPLYPAAQQYLPVAYCSLFWLPSQLAVFGLGIILFYLIPRAQKLGPAHSLVFLALSGMGAAMMISGHTVRVFLGEFSFAVVLVPLCLGL
ncbi:MAG TPA: acyltransferase, partial [Elusimicrobiota bacterium]|nr:acyltransferase [Elusimicrobiota bacterium]